MQFRCKSSSEMRVFGAREKEGEREENSLKIKTKKTRKFMLQINDFFFRFISQLIKTIKLRTEGGNKLMNRQMIVDVIISEPRKKFVSSVKDISLVED